MVETPLVNIRKENYDRMIRKGHNVTDFVNLVVEKELDREGAQ